MKKIDEGRSAELLVSERLARLEGRADAEDKSLARKLGQWIALLALTISIATGGFQVYENIILRERGEIAADRKTLAEYVRRITELNSRVASMHFSQKGNLATQVLAKTLNLEKISILGLAHDLLSKREEIASFASLITLSYEHLSFGNTARARVYSHRALLLATTDVERVVAQRIEAQTLFAPGKGQSLLRARKMFSRSLAATRNIEVFFRAELFADIYRNWILSELAFGDCEKAKELWKNFTKDMKDEYNGSQVLTMTMESIYQSMSGSRHCQLL